MQEIEVTWPRAIKVWWSFFWRAMLITVGVSVVIGFVIAIIQLATGTETELASLLGALLSIPAGMLAMKLALDVKYSDFRIALVPRENGTEITADVTDQP